LGKCKVMDESLHVLNLMRRFLFEEKGNEMHKMWTRKFEALKIF